MFQCIGSRISYIQRIRDWDNNVYVDTVVFSDSLGKVLWFSKVLSCGGICMAKVKYLSKWYSTKLWKYPKAKRSLSPKTLKENWLLLNWIETRWWYELQKILIILLFCIQHDKTSEFWWKCMKIKVNPDSRGWCMTEDYPIVHYVYVPPPLLDYCSQYFSKSF